MSDEPLIFTSKGNVPISTLTYETAWLDGRPQFVQFVERYRDASGEVVKESAHVYQLQGLATEIVAGSIT